MQTGGSNPGKLDYCEEVLEATGEIRLTYKNVVRKIIQRYLKCMQNKCKQFVPGMETPAKTTVG